ncbi:MAG: ABC transporter permease [Planctomycetes bacterium]|nr:ABC transporter permease [Planctomycetota bacterium]
MLAFVARRLLVAVPLLLVVSFVCFALTSLLPDPSVARLGQHATKANIEAFRRSKGLDDPFLARYGRFLAGAATLEFGEDIVRDDGRTIGAGIRERFPATFELALVAMVVAVVVGLAAGSLGAAFPRRVADAFAQVVAVVGSSVPVFWLGFMASLLFAVHLRWLPHPDWSLRTVAPGAAYATRFFLLESVARGDLAAVGRALSHLALPGLVLSTIPLAVVTRMTRSSMLEELGRDYVRTARAKGVRELGVVSRHAMKNALMPIVTVTGLQTGALLGGAVLTESVFAWPGLGRYVAEGVRSGNGPLVVAGVFTFAATFVVVNLVVDVVYHAVDPRLRRAS